MKTFQRSPYIVLGYYKFLRFTVLTIGRMLCLIGVIALLSATASAQTYWPPEHMPYYNGANPRPDLIPRGLYNAWVPYRKAYNRPSYLGGLAAHVIEPTSQEAMSWKENHDNGYYKTHCPTPIKHFYYPKPWEVLNTGTRPSGETSDSQFSGDNATNDLVPENPNPSVQRY